MILKMRERKRKVCVVLVDRANYGRMLPVMRAIRERPDLELITVCAGTMLLDRFGKAVELVERDGFEIHGRVYVELEGSVPATMAKSVGFAVIEFASEFQRLQPDIVLLIGDRYEALAAAIAAAYQNLCVAHIQGGEVSGSIDESARHAITKFAHYHFPATPRAAEYLVRMGEDPKTVFLVGCPVGDYIASLDGNLPPDVFNSTGIGAPINPEKPFLLVIYHPVTTEYEEQAAQTAELLKALDSIQHPTVWLWPNIDAGAEFISKSLRVFREHHLTSSWLKLIKNLAPEHFQKALKKAACAIGNSSSFVRDATFTGTPVVLVGDRQLGREMAENVRMVPCNADAITAAIRHQLSVGRYPPSRLYGDGGASKRIAEQISRIPLYTQKHLSYIMESTLGMK